MSTPHRILVVAGSDDARAALLSAIRARGHEAEPLTDLLALQRARWPWPPDVLLLDADLPALPGRPPPDALVLLRGLRLHCSLPVIVLGRGDDPVDRVLALESGADDCLGKPWLMRELTARIDAVLRRQRAGLPSAGDGQPGALSAGTWRLDPLTRRLCRQGGPEVLLTDAEFRVMRAFFERPRRAGCTRCAAAATASSWASRRDAPAPCATGHRRPACSACRAEGRKWRWKTGLLRRCRTLK